MQSTPDTITTSSTPISPFSSNSLRSEPTSDELPDLGAFTIIFHEFSNLHQPRPPPIPSPPTSTRTPSENESDRHHHSTVWTHRPIASYLTPDSDFHSHDSRSPSVNLSLPGSDTEGEHDGQTVEIEDISDIDDSNQPSLGFLDEALSFIAAERARFAAQREAGTKPTSENAWRHVIEPKRKRRRRRKALNILPPHPSEGAVPTETTEPTPEAEQDADDSSSSLDRPVRPYYKSTPATPARTRKEKHKQLNPKLSHSKSTPSLRLSLTIPPNPRILQLRSLAHKLRLLFPEDADSLAAILSNDFPDSTDFVDPRGPVPQSQDTLIHVFIDHSNILIGLLTYLKRSVRQPLRRPKRLSHTALALILERGRPITRRVLVTSSPLYQPMDSAEQLGYEVRVYARVPDIGDTQDRRQTNGNLNGGFEAAKGQWRKAYTKSHARKISAGTSTESEQSTSANSAGFSQAFVRSLAPNRALVQTNHSNASGTPTQPSNAAGESNHAGGGVPLPPPPPPPGPSTSTTRVRYREQGVDELLQLKLHQAIADVDVPPPKATIVLATGDGNVGEFNEDGFLGPVRTALKKGWHVELYAWEEGLSKAWMREFGEGPFKERFKIIGMEQFGIDMLEV